MTFNGLLKTLQRNIILSFKHIAIKKNPVNP